MKKYILSTTLLISEIIVYLLLGILFKMPQDMYIRTLITYLMLQIVSGHYKGKSMLVWDEIRKNMKVLFSYTACVLLYVPEASGGWVLLTFICVGVLMLVSATFLNRLLRIILRRFVVIKTLIIGDGEDAKRYVTITRNNRFTLIDVVGVVTVKPKNQQVNQGYILKNKKYPIYQLEEISKVIEKYSVEQVVILLPDEAQILTKDIMEILNGKAVRIKSKINSNGLVTFTSEVQDFDGLLLVSNSSAIMNGIDRILKRMIDVAAGIVGCILVVPMYFNIKKKMREEGDKGPVIFTQERIGRYGKPIKIYKFRTMVEDAEQRLNEMMEIDPYIYHEYTTNKKLVNDPRVTKIGQKLRNSSLDEFPQFFNVLKGEMSLVGPRPYLFNEKQDMGVYYKSIVSSKPGITGMWQANGRSDVGFDERCRLDDYYYRNWNLMMEFIIVYKTFRAVLYGKGAM